MKAIVCLLFLPLAPTIAVSAGPIPPLDLNHLPEDLQGVSQGWLRNNWPTYSQEALLVIKAYDLDEEVIPAFLHLFYGLLAEEHDYEMAYLRSIDENTPPDEALEKLNAFSANMPLGPDRMCDLVEKLLEPGDYSLQRVRLAELRARRDGLIWMKENTRLLAVKLRRRMKLLHLSQADLAPNTGKPMPRWAYAWLQRDLTRQQEEQERADEALAESVHRKAGRDPNGAARARPTETLPGISEASLDEIPKQDTDAAAPDPAAKEDGAESDGEDAGPLVAPHEDVTHQSWLAALRSCLARPRLSDADRQSAHKLFDAWWAKAQAVRELHKADYEQLASLTSRKAHRERLMALDTSLDGLFAEFSLRLAAIGPHPTKTPTASSP